MSEEHKVTIKRPNAVVMRIYGVISSYNFTTTLLNFARDHLNEYLEKHWTDKEVVRVVNRLRDDSKLDADFGEENVPVVINSPPKGENIEPAVNSVVVYIKWKIERGVGANSPIELLRHWIWTENYKNKTLKAHIFDDVPMYLDLWRLHMFIKLYTLSTGDSTGQKLFIQSTDKGDLTQFFNTYIQFSNEHKTDKKCYETITSMIRDRPDNLLFLTESPEEARAAISAGLVTIVTIREGKHLTDEDLSGLQWVRTFHEIEFIDEPNNPAPCC